MAEIRLKHKKPQEIAKHGPKLEKLKLKQNKNPKK